MNPHTPTTDLRENIEQDVPNGESVHSSNRSTRSNRSSLSSVSTSDSPSTPASKGIRRLITIMLLCIVGGGVFAFGMLGFKVAHEQKVRQELITEILKGDSPTVRRLLEAGADPNSVTSRAIDKPCVSTILRNTIKRVRNKKIEPKTTALMAAVIAKQGYIVSMLLEKGARVNEPDEYGFTALGLALSQGRLDIVQQLLAHGADPNIPNEAQIPLLNWAIMLREPEIAYTLLEHGASPSIPDGKGMLPLYLACVDEEVLVAKMLLDRGASPTTSLRGWSVLRLSVNLDNAELVQLLLDRGADPGELLPDGQTLVAYAREKKKQKALTVLSTALARGTGTKPEMPATNSTPPSKSGLLPQH